MEPNKTGCFSHPKILLGFVLLIVAATAIFLTTRPEENPYSFFSDSFGLALPEHTEVLFEEDAYGAMGDGYRLYAFSLPPGERDAFLSQGAMVAPPAAGGRCAVLAATGAGHRFAPRQRTGEGPLP